MGFVYDDNREPVAIRCDACKRQFPVKYGKQVAPPEKQVRIWDDRTDLCPECYEEWSEEKEP